MLFNYSVTRYLPSMKLRLARFIGAFYAFFIVMEVLRELLLSENFLNEFLQQPAQMILLLFQSSVLFLGYALFNYLFLFYAYGHRPRWFIAMGIVVISIGVIGLRYLAEEVIIKAITGYGNYYEGTTPLYYIGDNLYYAILYTSFGVIFYFVHYTQYRERQQQQLLLENKKTELAFLRSQVNPHFLFNMLNNIYSLITMQSPKALTATDKLSKLLRYSLYESGQKVTLEQEIQSIRDYVELQELRFRESVHINIHLDPIIAHQHIAPFILLPLVENSFKHGLATDPEQPIQVKAEKQGGSIMLEVGNAIARREKDEVGGIGIDNLKKRLQLIYNGAHTFRQVVTHRHFTTQITITP